MSLSSRAGFGEKKVKTTRSSREFYTMDSSRTILRRRIKKFQQKETIRLLSCRSRQDRFAREPSVSICSVSAGNHWPTGFAFQHTMNSQTPTRLSLNSYPKVAFERVSSRQFSPVSSSRSVLCSSLASFASTETDLDGISGR